MNALDGGIAILVICLDLSAAFHMVNHEILLILFEKRISLVGNYFACFRSYLINMSQKVLTNGATLSARNILVVFYKDLFLAPNSSIVYTLLFGYIMHKHDIGFHISANNNNLSLAFKPLGISSTFISMESLISDVQGWKIVNILRINDTNTDFTVINGLNCKTLDVHSLRVVEVGVMSSTCIKALEVHIIYMLNMKKKD